MPWRCRLVTVLFNYNMNNRPNFLVLLHPVYTSFWFLKSEEGSGCDHTAKLATFHQFFSVKPYPCALSFNFSVLSPYIEFVSRMLQGYKRQEAFIATQMPLQHTVVDFLRLVFDFDVSLIVMLNEITKDMVRAITLPSIWVIHYIFTSVWRRLKTSTR